MWNAPLSVIGFLSSGKLPRNNMPPVLLPVFSSERYDASEFMLSIMFDAQNWIVASGLVASSSKRSVTFYCVLVVVIVCSIAKELSATTAVLSMAQA